MTKIIGQYASYREAFNVARPMMKHGYFIIMPTMKRKTFIVAQTR